MGNCCSTPCCKPDTPCIDVDVTDNDTVIMCCMIKIKRNSNTQINSEPPDSNKNKIVTTSI